MAEAAANGADRDFDLPAFDEALVEIQQTGDVGDESLTALTGLAPIAASALPLVQRLRQSEADLAQSEADLELLQRAVDALKGVSEAAAGTSP